jgi:hypothetical protein
MAKLTVWDIRNRKYSLTELEANIDNLQVKDIVCNQTLDADFCAKYILDVYRATCEEDLWLINIDYVLYHQPNIDKKELEEKMILYDR